MSRNSRFAVSLPAALLVFSSACGSSSAPPEFDDTELPPHPTNPAGVPYPTDHIGSVPRANGRVGDRIENFTFQGYDHGNVSAGLKTFGMADYYDPKAAKTKTIILLGAATWCSACAGEADEIVNLVPGLEQQGAVILSVITAGPSAGYGPQLSDVDSWVTDHKSNYTTLIDVRARRLTTVGLTGVPWSAIIDPRTMEILFASDGNPDDFMAFVNLGLDFVKTTAPGY